VYTSLRESIKYQVGHRPSIWIPIAYAIILLLISPLHNTFNEWGGVMQYFAGQEILSGNGYQGWASHFWPPMFSVLISLASLLVSGFFAGKLISIIASAALVYVTFHFAIELMGQKWIGLWAQAFLVVNPLYFFESLRANNHLLDAMFFVAGLWLFFRALREPRPRRFVAAGLVCGLAGLSRHTSYVLIFLPFFLALVLDFRSSAKSAIAFWGGFTLISLPWWFFNTVQNGWPLDTWQHLNVCAGVIFGFGGAGQNLWRCSGQSNINGVLDILAAYPVDYLKNVIRNIFESGKLLVRYGGVLIPFVIPAILDSFLSIKTERWVILFGELALSIFLVSQAFVNYWYFMNWIVMIILLSVAFVVRYLTRWQERYPMLIEYHFRSLSLILLVVIGIVLTSLKLATYLDEGVSYLPLVDLDQVTQALKEHDPHLKTKIIMAIDPARAYYAGSKFLVTPSEYEGSAAGLVSYQGLSERLKAYAPKYPSDMEGDTLHADYLIYTRTPDNTPAWELQELPQFSFLLDPESDEIPENFKLVYQSINVVVYEIDWGGR
jgi:hypothetical protein